MSKEANHNLISVTGLKTYFPVRGAWLKKLYVRAVDGVSFSIPRGKTLALVGESGSGKTTVGRTILRLIPATAGQVVFEGYDLLSLPRSQLRALRRRMQIIFQDPVGSLNPRMTVGSIIAEPIKVHRLADTRRQRREMVEDLLSRVGLEPLYASRYPHEFSGGQRQRIGIARALASRPDFVVCDEPVSALDVSIQSQVLNLLSDLQEQFGLTYLFIAHNLAVVEHFADLVAVMYLGRIVEIAGRDELYANPRHPYTESLFSAVPVPDPTRRSRRVRLEGETPSPINPPSGCPFHPRCPLTRRLGKKRGQEPFPSNLPFLTMETVPDPFSSAPAAGQTPFGPTCPIASQGRSVQVVARCVHEVPELLPTPDKPDHCHACHLRR